MEQIALENVTLRRARPDDLDRIIELAVEMVVHSVSPMRLIAPDEVRTFRLRDIQSIREALALPTVGVFVAEGRAGEFLGHVIVVAGNQESSTGEAQGWIFDLSIREEYWGLGIGKILMAEAERFAREQGLRYVGLGVTTSNERALRFYESLGYLEERKRMLKLLPASHDGN